VIDSGDKLAHFVQGLAAAEWVALDTEADSLHSYPEKLCLLQLSIPDADVLIDPLAGLNLQPLWQVLRGRELIMHGADYDLRLLRRGFHFVPAAVFDTMWAARLSGCRQFSLTYLVRHYLGVELEKGPQKANWARRPLTPRMVTYARNDTHYLKALADLLRAELRAKDRLGWLQECCERMIADCAQVREQDTDLVWRVSGSARLDRRGLAVLRELWSWREREAVQARKPPYFILSHERLVEIAARAAAGEPFEELVPQRMSPRRRVHLEKAVQAGRAVPAAQLPEVLRPTGRRLSERERRRLADLTHRRDRCAQELNIDPTLIASRAMLVSLARDGAEAQAQLLPWQRELLFGADAPVSPGENRA
jgi:ribonuclease D